MKYIKGLSCIKCLLPLILLFTISSCDNNTKNKKGKSLGYDFPTPKNWQTERIPFPIEFAPQISYSGFEDLRFAPGWEFTTSEEHWSYAFLWWLDGSPQIDNNILQENLKMYYTGLVARNIKPKNIPASKVITSAVVIKQIETTSGDIETYQGTVTIVDYLDLMFNPITLNCMIHKKDCAGHIALIFQISPKPLGHPIWKSLNKLQSDFKCGLN